MFRHLFSCTGGRLLGCAAAATATVTGLGTWQAQADGQAADKVCIDKLACHRNVASPRTPTILVSCGSFNPPTIAHLRMFDLATAALAERGFDVWGCYMSPVADAYGKKGLAPVHHRLEMCRLAAAGTDNVMVDAWEAAQPGYTRTLQVLRHVSSSLQAYMEPQPQKQQRSDAAGTSSSDVIHAHGLAAAAAAAANLSATADHAAGAVSATSTSGRSSHSGAGGDGGDGDGSISNSSSSTHSPQPRVMLLCGADLLGTLNMPGVWKDPDAILKEHGIVCVCRAGTDVQQLLSAPGTLLHQHRDNVLVVQEPVGNDISSTRVRQLLADGQPVRYLLPDAVLAYIQEHSLYGTA